ncbi:VOC family protein [Saccharopolyspora sp. NPDC002686]|uniref:VOC family protein n=1 Tax=Saccharopolyspora sp. NPDC002686 TaxID=3154541 RepID=UPI0033274EC9
MAPVVVEFSAREPERLARWWADVLGWHLDGTSVRPTGAGVELRFVPSSTTKTGKNGVHLDLRSESHDDQNKIVERLFNAGARFADIDQSSDVPWVVMADVEGNELCVLEPRKVYERTGPVAAIVVDTPDPRAQARSWAETTGMDLVGDRAEFASLRPPSGEGPHLEFLAADSGPTGMLRLLAE